MDSRKPDNRQKEENENAWWQPHLMLFARLSSWVAGPVVAGYYLGSYLSDKFRNGYIFLAVVGISFLLSMFGLVREVGREYKKLEDSLQNDGKKDKNNS